MIATPPRTFLDQYWARLRPEQIAERIQAQIEQARIPSQYRACAFQTLDPTLDPEAFQICQAFAEQGEHEGQKGLLLMGTPGNGKTSLAVAVLRRIVEQTQGRYSVRFWNVPTGLDQVRQAIQEDGPPTDPILDLTHNRLLVIDDVGKQQRTPWVNEQLYKVLENMDTPDKGVVVTTNQTPAQLRQALEPALLSRLLRMCHPVVLQGPDQRLQGRGRAIHPLFQEARP